MDFFTALCNIPAHLRVSPIKTTKQLNITIMDGDLREVLMAPSILGSLGLVVYFFTRVVTDYILKKKMIEKGFVNDDTQAIFKQHTSDNRYSSLKWGMIIFFAGMALIIMEFIPTSPDSPLPYGLLAVSISLGFLIYYFMVQKDSK